MPRTQVHAHVVLNVDTLPQFFEALAMLEMREVLVGVPADKNERKPEPGEKGKPPTNSEIAYIQNYGSPAQNIPARPFLEPGIKNAQPQIEKSLYQSACAALDGDAAGVDQGFERAGLVAVNGIRNEIRTGDFKPLSKRTLAARKRRGRKGEKPLQDTGQLRNAITYVKRNRT